MDTTNRIGICEGIDALELDLSQARVGDPAGAQRILAGIVRLERALGSLERKQPRKGN
jgi:hypothetical protein